MALRDAITALLVAIGAAALVPAFAGASDSINFSNMTYGGGVATVVGQFELVAALVAVAFIGSVLVSKT